MTRARRPERARLLAARDLAPGGPEAARALLTAYAPWSPDQARERDHILAFLDAHGDALLRTCAPGHLTASALVLDASGERCLLTHHKKLGRWLQLGGHCDGDGNLARVALREAIEESGIPDLRIDPRPIDVDVHPIPARRDEPEHLHLDTRFVVWAPPGAEPVCSAESHAVVWFGLDDLPRASTDDSVLRLVTRARSRS